MVDVVEKKKYENLLSRTRSAMKSEDQDRDFKTNNFSGDTKILLKIYELLKELKQMMHYDLVQKYVNVSEVEKYVEEDVEQFVSKD